MRIFAIDPGTAQSAYVIFKNGLIQEKGIYPNPDIPVIIETAAAIDLVAIEFIQCYGMAVGREVYETVWWAGRFGERASVCYGKDKVKRFARPTIKSFLTGIPRAKDPDVRRALMTRYGGTKKGEPLHGVANDMWAALAVAAYVYESSKTGTTEEW